MRAAFVVTDLAAAVMGAAVRAAPELKMDLPDWRKTPVLDHDLGHGIHMLESFGGNRGWSRVRICRGSVYAATSGYATRARLRRHGTSCLPHSAGRKCSCARPS
jgi:hypothetical protein